ncbi:MAG: ATP synthase F0 subunit C [Nitrospinota bacterium]
MSRKLILKVVGLLMVLGGIITVDEVFAAEGAHDAATIEALGMIGFASIVGVGLAAAGCGIGMGQTVNGALNAMSRNPGVYDRIFMNMMIGLALIEAFVIYTLVLSFIFMYATPWSLAG